MCVSRTVSVDLWKTDKPVSKVCDLKNGLGNLVRIFMMVYQGFFRTSEILKHDQIIHRIRLAKALHSRFCYF